MKRMKFFLISAALLAVIGTPILMGCNFLVYQFCVTNGTEFNLKEVNIVPQDALSWGPNLLGAVVLPNGSADIKGFLPGTYMVRGVFDVVNGGSICENEIVNGESIFVNTDLTITTTNICIDYSQTFVLKDGKACGSIYGTPRFAI